MNSGSKLRRQIQNSGALGQIVGHRLRRQLRHLQTRKQSSQLLQRRIERQAARSHQVGNLQHAGRITGEQASRMENR